MERQKDMLEQAIEEKGLMREWEQHWHEQNSSYSRFNQDGIVNYERWAELPVMSIFVCKLPSGISRIKRPASSPVPLQ